MFKRIAPVLLALAPFAVLGAGMEGLLERVPTLSGTVAGARALLPQHQAEAAALQRDIDAAQTALQAQLANATAAAQRTAEQQMGALRGLTGFDADELDEEDDGAFEARMLGQLGMSVADMEALEEMDDEEAEAFFASRQFNTAGLSAFAAAAPTSSNPAQLARLTTEYGDWAAQDAARRTNAIAELLALDERWAQAHAALDTRLNTELEPRLKAVPIVDCGEAGDYQDAIALHALELERAEAHANIAPDHLQQAVTFLSSHREAVKADAVFADRFAADAAGVEEVAVQAINVQQVALQRIRELLLATMELNRKVVSWDERKDALAAARPNSTCG